MEARFGRSQGDAECRGRVGQLEIVTEAERKERSILGVEMAHGARDLVTIRQSHRAVGHRWRLVEAERHDVEGLLASTRVDGGVDGDPAEPRRPALEVAQPRQLPPGSHECFLERVLGVERVAQDGQGQPVRLGRFQHDEVHECVAVSGSGCDD